MVLFRKEAEKILQDHGFGKDFTVSRVDRHIWLVGKCTKQIVQVSDLEIGNKLTKAERELLITDYLYTNIIANKDKIDKLLSMGQDIENIKEQLDIVEKNDLVYIDTDYSYSKSRNIVYIVIQVGEDGEYKATLKETLDTGEKYVHMNSVPQEKTCDVYNKLVGKSPIRDRVFNLYNKKLKLENDTLDIKRELKIVC